MEILNEKRLSTGEAINLNDSEKPLSPLPTEGEFARFWREHKERRGQQRERAERDLRELERELENARAEAPEVERQWQSWLKGGEEALLHPQKYATAGRVLKQQRGLVALLERKVEDQKAHPCRE